MKACSAALASHLAQDSTTTALLWKLIRTDGTILGFTNHDQAISFTDSDSVGQVVVYEPTPGLTPSATDTTSDMSTSQQTAIGFLESESLTETDIFAGKYDYARVEIRLVNWADLTMGALLLKNSTMGVIKTKNGVFEAELRGLEFYLGTTVGDTYGPTCRWDLGDSTCTINLAEWIQDGTVMSASDFRTFVPNSGLLMIGSATPSLPAPAGWFTFGIVTWLTGLNAGYAMECASWDGTTVELFENMPYTIQAGDTFSIEPGCDHSTGSNGCTKYSNIVNFGGESFIPGMDQLMIYPNGDGSITG